MAEKNREEPRNPYEVAGWRYELPAPVYNNPGNVLGVAGWQYAPGNINMFPGNPFSGYNTAKQIAANRAWDEWWKRYWGGTTTPKGRPYVPGSNWAASVIQKIFGKSAMPAGALVGRPGSYGTAGQAPTSGWNAAVNQATPALSQGTNWNYIANNAQPYAAQNLTPAQVAELARMGTPVSPSPAYDPTLYKSVSGKPAASPSTDWYFGEYGPDSPFTEHGGSLENWNEPGQFAGWRTEAPANAGDIIATNYNRLTGEPDYYLTSTGSERSRWGSPAYMGAPYLNSGMQKKSYSGPPQGPAGAWISKLSDEDKLAMGWKKINDTTWSGTWSKPKRIEMEAWDSPSAKRRRKKNAPNMPTKTAPVGYGTQGAAGGPAAGWRV